MENYTGVKVGIKTLSVGKSVGVFTEEFNIIKGQDYVFQFKIIPVTSHSTFDNVYIKIGSNTIKFNSINLSECTIVNEFDGLKEYLYYGSFKSTSYGGKSSLHIGRLQTSADKSNSVAFYVREVQVEKGVMKSGWRPNDNEHTVSMKKMQSQIELLSNKIELSTAMQEVDDIKAIIRNLEANISLLSDKISLSATSQDINSMSGRVENTNARLDVEAGKIALKVSKDEVISSINLSPEKLKIDAKNIDMSGNLDLNGTFKCYQNAAQKTGNYLYQSGAIHRGYLSNGKNPVFSSGIWRPDGVNDVGFVSVGWSNSDHVDANGCLWLSPRVNGGASLHYGQLRNSSGVHSGIDYFTDGTVQYSSFMSNRQNSGQVSHKFDGGISTYTLKSNFVDCSGSVRCDSTIYSNTQYLYLCSGGYSPTYFLQLRSDGYFFPQGAIQLGTSGNPFYQLVCTYAPAVVSDARKKEDIKYINTTSVESKSSNILTTQDMHDYVRDIKLATYRIKDSRSEDENKVEIGFIAQDVIDTKVGKYIVNDTDKDNLVYDMANRISVLEGALQYEINIREEELKKQNAINTNLLKIVEELENRLSKLENNISA